MDFSGNRHDPDPPQSRGEAMAILMTFYIGSGLLLSAISVPLILRKIGPNPLYGFRVKQTLEDPRVWYDVNAYAAKGFFWVGLLIIAAALTFSRVPGWDVGSYALACLATFMIAIVATLVLSFRYLGQVSKTR
jgi:hypothetical protein